MPLRPLGGCNIGSGKRFKAELSTEPKNSWSIGRMVSVCWGGYYRRWGEGEGEGGGDEAKDKVNAAAVTAKAKHEHIGPQEK